MSVTRNRNSAMLGGGLAIIVAFGVYAALQTWKAWTLGTDWIEISRLIVSDAEVGEDPRIIYERKLKIDAPGTWAVNVFRHRDKDDVTGVVWCSGSGVASYKAGRPLPPAAITLSWLMGKPCHFERGTYRAVVTVILSPPGYPAKVVEKESNYFVVPPQQEVSQ